MTRKTLVTLLLLALVLAAVWALTAYQRARKTQELLTQLAERDEGVAMEAMTQLRHRGRSLEKQLMPYLASDNERVRWRAAILMGEMGKVSPEAAEKLVSLLVDPVPAVQRAAAVSCGTLHLESATAPLLQLVKDDKQTPGTRALAAQALGRLRARSAVDALKALLKDHPPVQPKEEEEEATAEEESSQETATAKAEEGEEAAAEETAEEEEEAPPPDEMWQARMEAAWALGRIGAPECVEPLAEAVRDDVEPRVDVRVAAVYALGDVGRNAAMENIVSATINALIEALGDEAGDVRLAAAV
ncbi:MAG: HEAT repeat domain-containing protein, partial [Armatimonadetes bacterium]|nr:HEAT repeat domain-containing protein [Armatimonadota bacterium]